VVVGSTVGSKVVESTVDSFVRFKEGVTDGNNDDDANNDGLFVVLIVEGKMKLDEDDGIDVDKTVGKKVGAADRTVIGSEVGIIVGYDRL
jgi:hypothetical protein